MSWTGRKPGDGHEQPAANINSIDELKKHLCDGAFRAGKRREKDLLPERCATCESACCYGERFLELLREDGRDYTNGRKIYHAGEIAEIMRSAPVDLSIKRALRRRARSGSK